jgi:hypothetical protein
MAAESTSGVHLELIGLVTQRRSKASACSCLVACLRLGLTSMMRMRGG